MLKIAGDLGSDVATLSEVIRCIGPILSGQF
jgi:hypothetical protein